MSHTIGRITVPSVINSGQIFPLTNQHPFGLSVERPVIVHPFGSLDAKQEQRYYLGIGPRKFQFKRPNLGWTEANQLKAFWAYMQGPWKAFTNTVPNPGGSATGVLVTFEQTSISFEYLRNATQVGLNLIEVVDPTQAPSYTINTTCLRFPSTALSTALLSEVQQIVPLVHIRVRESAVPDIFLRPPRHGRRAAIPAARYRDRRGHQRHLGQRAVHVRQGSQGWYFHFDFLECTVASDVPDPVSTTTVGAVATDFDTDSTYELSPAAEADLGH